MMDKRLQQIAKPERNRQQREMTKQKLLVAKRKQYSRDLWLRRSLLIAIAAIALFFIVTPSKPFTEQSAYTPFTLDSDIVRLDTMENMVTNRNPNIAYPIYLERKTLQQSPLFAELQNTLLIAQKNMKPYPFKISEGFGAREYLMTFANGEQRQIKFVRFMNDDYIYDMKVNVHYKLTDKQAELFDRLYLQADIEKQANLKWIILLFGIFIVLAIVDTFVFEKRYLLVSRKEARKHRRPWNMVGILNVLLIVLPLNFLRYFIGATNLVIVILGFIAAIIVNEYVDIKAGIKRPSKTPIVLAIVQIILIFIIFSI